MNKVLVSTGCLIGRPNGRNFYLLKDLCPKLDCDGLELLMYDTWYDRIEEFARFIPTLSLPVCAFHVEKQVGELISHRQTEEALSRMEINCSLAKRLGAKTLVLHLYNGVISDKNIEYNVECFKYLEEIAVKYDLTLTVENVVCSVNDPFSNMARLIEAYPHAKLTFDTKMAQFHKQTELLYTEYEYLSPHFAHLHVNDYSGGYMDWSNLKVLPVGMGDVDFDRFFAFIKQIGYEGDYTTEATAFDRVTGEVDVDKVNATVEKIRGYIN